MRRFIIAIAVALSVPSQIARAQPDAKSQFETELAAYFRSIHTFATKQLDEIYRNASPAVQNAVPRRSIEIEVRGGDDGLCYDNGRFKLGAVQSSNNARIIVLCEPDIAIAVDFFISSQLAYASIATSFPVSSNLKDPLPDEAVGVAKASVRRLLAYYLSENATLKEERFLHRTRITAPCFPWQATYKDSQNKQVPIRCSRRELSVGEDSQAAEWAMQQWRTGLQVAAKMMGQPANNLESAILPRDTAFNVMHAMRASFFEYLVFYVVAHEFGHIATSTPSEQGLRAEVEADRYAAMSIDTFQARAASLPLLSMALGLLWRTEGRDVDLVRADALREVVFCENSGKLRTAARHPLEINFLATWSADCKGTAGK